MVLPVRHDDDYLLHGALIVESRHRALDSLRDHRSLPRDGFRMRLAQVCPRRRVIERHRKLDEARPREQYDADLVPRETGHQVRYLQLGALQSIRPHVLRQHTPRYIQRDHYLHAPMLHDLHVAPPLRTRQRYDHESRADEPQYHSPQPRARVDGRAQTLDQRRISHARDRRPPTRNHPPHEPGQHRQRAQHPQILWSPERHSNPLTVSS